MNRRTLEILRSFACGVSLLLLVGAGPTGQVDKSDLQTLGLKYQFQELKQPRPNRVHILRVDFSTGKIKPVVVVGKDPDGDGPAETALTSPLKLAAGPSVLAFINTNPWDSFPDKAGKRNRNWYEGQPVNISGVAASGGKTRSPAQANETSVWVDRRGRVRMGRLPGLGKTPDEIPEADRVVEAMAGFQLIVKAGTVVPAAGGAVHPRTAIGVDRSGKVMWLVVVDGRQRRFSEGMNVHELGQQMVKLGCWNAMTWMEGAAVSWAWPPEKQGFVSSTVHLTDGCFVAPCRPPKAWQGSRSASNSETWSPVASGHVRMPENNTSRLSRPIAATLLNTGFGHCRWS